MNTVTIRAKTDLKLKTAEGNSITISFPKGDHVEGMCMELVHALVQNVGTVAARKLLETKLARYDKEYKGLGK